MQHSPNNLFGQTVLISFHEDLKNLLNASRYANAWRSADVDDFYRIAKCIVKFPWSPIIWRGGVRNKTKFVHARFCALDFDNGQITLSDACDIFKHHRHIIGTTKSHQKEKNKTICDRFRVVLQFEELVADLRIYEWSLQALLKQYPIDRKALDGAHFFWPCEKIISVNDRIPDLGVEVKKDVPQYFGKSEANHLVVFRKNKVFPAWLADMLEKPFPYSERNNTLFSVSCSLLELGFSSDEIEEIIIEKKVIDFTYRWDPDELRTTINSACNHILKQKKERDVTKREEAAEAK